MIPQRFGVFSGLGLHLEKFDYIKVLVIESKVTGFYYHTVYSSYICRIVVFTQHWKKIKSQECSVIHWNNKNQIKLLRHWFLFSILISHDPDAIKIIDKFSEATFMVHRIIWNLTVMYYSYQIKLMECLNKRCLSTI